MEKHKQKNGESHWEDFARTGRISDYLAYKRQQEQRAEEELP